MGSNQIQDTQTNHGGLTDLYLWESVDVSEQCCQQPARNLIRLFEGELRFSGCHFQPCSFLTLEGWQRRAA